jgi:hypothetical protein
MEKRLYNVSLVGRRFGRLIVKEPAGKVKNEAFWLCMCDCGNKKIVRGGHLKSGDTSSCGCLKRENIRKSKFVHGAAIVGKVTREYGAWQNMKKRCLNPKSSDYKNYGGRGIKVCDRWVHNFKDFFSDMGKCPPGLTLERIDNNGNYEPSNCRWATRKEQGINTRNNRRIELNGQIKTVSEWAEITDIPDSTLRTRLRDGWTPEVTVTTARDARHDRKGKIIPWLSGYYQRGEEGA